MINPLHINMNNNTFSLKRTVLSETRQKFVRMALFNMLQMSGLIQDSWILISASVLSLLWYHTLCIFWKTPLCNPKRVTAKKVNNMVVLLERFWSCGPEEAFLDPTLRTLGLQFRYFSLWGDLRIKYREKLTFPALEIVEQIRGRTR